MSNSTGTHSYSSKISYDAAGGTTYTDVIEIIEMKVNGKKVPATLLTNLNSPGGAHEKRPKLIDAGTVTFTLNWTKSQYNTFLTNLRNALMGWKITFPLVGAEVTASKEEFKGHISNLGVAIPDDDRIISDVEIEVSGLPTFTQGS
jgi:Lambda phage tail tube protein, TTP